MKYMHLFIALCTFSATALAEDAATPTLDDIAKRLAEARAAVKTLAVTQEERQTVVDPTKPHGPVDQAIILRQTWYDGKRYKCETHRFMSDLSVEAPSYFQELYNGKLWIRAEIRQNGMRSRGVVTKHRSTTSASRLHWLYEVSGDAPPENVFTPEVAKITGTEEIDGAGCVVVEGRKGTPFRLWYNPQMGQVVKGELLDNRGNVMEECRFTDWKQSAPGVWIPTTLYFIDTPSNTQRVIDLKAVVNHDLPEDVFTIKWGEEARIFDATTGKRYTITGNQPFPPVEKAPVKQHLPMKPAPAKRAEQHQPMKNVQADPKAKQPLVATSKPAKAAAAPAVDKRAKNPATITDHLSPLYIAAIMLLLIVLILRRRRAG